MSLAPRDTTCTPSTLRVPTSKTILKRPCFVRVYCARVTFGSGCLTTSTSCPAARASSLGQPDGAELRIGEDRRRQRRVVGAPVADAEHVVDREPRLVLRRGRELRPDGDVADRPDPVDARALSVVDDDVAAVRLDAGPLERELLGVRQRGRTRAAHGRRVRLARREASATVDVAVARERRRRRVRARPRSPRPRAQPAAPLAASASARAAICGPWFTIVTREPKRAKICANSSPTGPAPTTSSDSGICSSSSALTWSIQSTSSMPGTVGTAVREPVAIRMRSAVSSRSPTRTVCASDERRLAGDELVARPPSAPRPSSPACGEASPSTRARARGRPRAGPQSDAHPVAQLVDGVRELGRDEVRLRGPARDVRTAAAPARRVR